MCVCVCVMARERKRVWSFILFETSIVPLANTERSWLILGYCRERLEQSECKPNGSLVHVFHLEHKFALRPYWGVHRLFV